GQLPSSPLAQPAYALRRCEGAPRAATPALADPADRGTFLCRRDPVLMPVATPPRERSPSEAWAAGGVRAVSPYRRQSQHRRTPRRRPLFERLERPPLGNDAARARLLSFGQVPRGRRLGLAPQSGHLLGDIVGRVRWHC